MEDVERLEIIRGPGGSLWGANAVNGIVNVVTRPAATTPETFVHLGAGSERRQLALRHGRPIPGGGLRFDAERMDRGRSAAAGDKPVRDDWHMQRVGFRADVERGPADHLTLLGNVRGGSVGQSVTFVMQVSPAVARTQYFDADLLALDVLVAGATTGMTTTNLRSRPITTCSTAKRPCCTAASTTRMSIYSTDSALVPIDWSGAEDTGGRGMISTARSRCSWIPLHVRHICSVASCTMTSSWCHRGWRSQPVRSWSTIVFPVGVAAESASVGFTLQIRVDVGGAQSRRAHTFPRRS